jgi:hypothetical protein
MVPFERYFCSKRYQKVARIKKVLKKIFLPPELYAQADEVATMHGLKFSEWVTFLILTQTELGQQALLNLADGEKGLEFFVPKQIRSPKSRGLNPYERNHDEAPDIFANQRERSKQKKSAEAEKAKQNLLEEYFGDNE